MGSFCCCPCADDLDEYSHPSNSVYRHCLCLRYFLQQLFNGYSATFHRLESRPISSPTQGATSMASSGLASILPDNHTNDFHLSLSRPLPYDADQRHSRLQRGLVLRRDKSSSHFQEETQPLRRNSSSSGMETLGSGKKLKVNDSEDDGIVLTESSEKALSMKLSYGLTTIQPIDDDDEDVCPTCLDDYTVENPKIITRCSHHFHLGCIYEWMERSENCPICGKEMEFCESP